MPTKRKPVSKKVVARKAPAKSSGLKSSYKLSKKQFSTTLFAFVMLGVLIGGYLLVKSRAALDCKTCAFIGTPAEGPVTVDGQTYDAKVELEDFATNLQIAPTTNGDACYGKYKHIYSGDPFENRRDGGWNVWIRKYPATAPLSQMQAPFTIAEIPDASSYMDVTEYQKAKGDNILYNAYQLSKYLSSYGRNAYKIMSINQNPYIDDADPSSLVGNSAKLGERCRVAKAQSAVALVKVTNTGTATWGKGANEGIDGNGDIVNLSDPSIKRPNPTLQTTIDGNKANQLFGGASSPVTTTTVKPGESVELRFTFYDNGKFKFGGQTIGVSEPGIYQIPVQMVLPGKAWFGNRVDIGFMAVDDILSSKWVNQEVGPYSNNPVTPAPTTGGSGGSTSTPKTKPKPSNPWDALKNLVN